MSWSQTIQTENLHDQMTILIGSAIQLLCGEAGVFVVSNEAFDPQSSDEYTPYRLSEAALAYLLEEAQAGVQPNTLHPLMIAPVTPDLAVQLGFDADVVVEQP